jgi:hypothetical protein
MAADCEIDVVPRHAATAPGRAVTLVAVLMTAWCLGFAAVNVVFEATDHFAGPQYAQYDTALRVMDWLVVALKLLGAAVAVLSLRKSFRWVSARTLTVLVWGAFATLAVYSLGGVVEGIAMATGALPGRDRIDATDLAYLAFFLLAASGYGVLAVSRLRRHRQPWSLAAVGALAAPLVLSLVLVVAPALLTAAGLAPAS